MGAQNSGRKWGAGREAPGHWLCRAKGISESSGHTHRRLRTKAGWLQERTEPELLVCNSSLPGTGGRWRGVVSCICIDPPDFAPPQSPHWGTGRLHGMQRGRDKGLCFKECAACREDDGELWWGREQAGHVESRAEGSAASVRRGGPGGLAGCWEGKALPREAGVRVKAPRR